MQVRFYGELRGVKNLGEFKRRNGEIGYNVSVTVESEDESRTFVGNEELLRAYQSGVIQKGEYYEFVADYNPNYRFNQFVVVSAK